MQLIGRDGTSPLATGSDEIRMQSLADLSYEFLASSIDSKALMSAMQYQRENSYDAIARMRLEGLACGYSIPYSWNPTEGWFEGELQSLICNDAGESVARSSSTELIYSVDRHHPLSLAVGARKRKSRCWALPLRSVTTTASSLKRLKEKSVITSPQLSAFNKIRNSVMHGNLLSPFSHEEEDKKLSDLAELVHALTRELLRTNDANYQAIVSG
jgi:hypothetical protein